MIQSDHKCLLNVIETFSGYSMHYELKAFYCKFAMKQFNIMNITLVQSPVSFTNDAIDEINRLMQVEEFDQNKSLRIGVKGGGCSGMTYILGFDEAREEDEKHAFEGLSFIMNRSHEMYLLGMQIDWHGGLNARGFTFSNPNASKTCGCGTSFAV